MIVPRFADWCVLWGSAQQQWPTVRSTASHVDPQQQQVLETCSQQLLSRSALPTGLVFVPQVPDATRLPGPWPRVLERVAATSLIMLPLVGRGTKFGAICFGRNRDQAYTEADARLAQELTIRVALAIEHIVMCRKVEDAEAVRDDFVAIASHELRTPLTIVLGNMQILQRRLLAGHMVTDRDVQRVDTAVDQALRLNRLISGVLDVTRLQSGQFQLETQAVDVVALVRRVAGEWQPLVEQRRVVIDTPAKDVIVIGDALRLEQALLHVFQNAARYSPQETAIELAVKIEHSQAVITIQDHGIGIPEEALPHLFDRFYRAPNVCARHLSGLGVGLFVVREIIDRHGGSIAVESALDQGSTFIISLPLAEATRSLEHGK